MYIRDRIPSQDDCELIAMTGKAFDISYEFVETVLQNAQIVKVCCDNNKIVGYICYRFITHDLVLANFLVIKPKYQGTGIVRKFFPCIIKEMKQQGVRAIYGLVNEDNEESLEIFSKFGFSVLEKLNNVYVIRLNIEKI